MAQSLVAGLLMGVTIAICGQMILALAAALWLRRPRAVAVAALLGMATADLVLCAAAVWVGSSVAAVVPDAGLRSSIAVGLFLGVAGWLVLRRLIGSFGVPGNAVLPTRPITTWARFAAIGLFGPVPVILVVANVVAWPRLTAEGAGVAFVVGTVIGALAIRWQWAVAAARNRGIRSTRSMHAGVGLAGILLIAVWVIGIVAR